MKLLVVYSSEESSTQGRGSAVSISRHFERHGHAVFLLDVSRLPKSLWNSNVAVSLSADDVALCHEVVRSVEDMDVTLVISCSRDPEALQVLRTVVGESYVRRQCTWDLDGLSCIVLGQSIRRRQVAIDLRSIFLLADQELGQPFARIRLEQGPVLPDSAAVETPGPSL